MLFWVLIAAAGFLVLFILGVLLPVTVSVCLSGGTERGFSFMCRVMGYGGIIGGAVAFDGTDYHLSPMIGQHRFGRIRLTPLVEKGEKKLKKKKRAEVPVEKPPLREKLKRSYERFTAVWPYAKEGYRDFWYVVGIDRFVANVSYGFARPALLGKLIGAIAFINAILPHPFSITQSFDFTRRMIQGELDTALKIRMHRLWKILFKYRRQVIAMAYKRTKHKPREADHIIVQEVV